MMKIRKILLFLFLVAGTVLNGQYTKEFKRIFFDADYLFETGFYEEAFSRYKNLLTLDPGNSNILFHCGACCLNIQGSEEQAITYLKEATEGVVMSYKENSHKEAGAPVFSYYLLAQAYHLNYQFEDAKAQYTTFLENGENQDPIQLEYTQLQIESCDRAYSIDRKRPSFEFQNVLEHFDNELPSCSNPVISGDGNILIFLVDYPSDKKIMMTTRTDELWSRPRVINSEIGMVGETYPVSLSFDGQDLYLAHQFYSHSDIFVSHLEGKRWSDAEDIGYKINGRTSENHASISRDGKSLYFTSDVRGGSGSFDIYVSHLDEEGEWGEPENLGAVINTPFEEHTPFISKNDSILFFSSQGHATIGGLDVFHSRLGPDGTWSEPESMGYPVNTTGDDIFFNPGWDELEGYYAVRREDDPTSNTINMVMELEQPEELAQELRAEVPVKITAEVPIKGSEEVPEEVPAEVPAEVSAEALPEEPSGSIETTVEMVIEPPDTDEIEDVLNQGRKPETEPVAPDPVPTSAPSPPVSSELYTSIPFEFNEFDLSMPAMLEAEKIADLMVNNSGTTVEITGHADATGREEYNLLLSMQRAEQLADYLEMRGVELERIQVDGRGESAPLAKNRYSDGSDAPLGRYLNRQVQVKISGKLPVETGLSGLYIPANLRNPASDGQADASDDYLFTIQLKAARSPIPASQLEGADGVHEYVCKDGFYRYAVGSYRTFQEARTDLKSFQKMGYMDAFIQTMDWYERATK